MLERIGVDHFEQDPFVARQPVAEDAVPFAVEHSPTVLDPMRWIAGSVKVFGACVRGARSASPMSPFFIDSFVLTR